MICGKRSVLAVLAFTVAAVGGVVPETNADVLGRAGYVVADHHVNDGRISLANGNGRFNKNYATVLSPTVNRGLQQVANTNVSGRTTTQVAFCKKKTRVCKIHQQLGDPDW